MKISKTLSGLLSIAVILCLSVPVSAQSEQTGIITGTIVEASTGETLIGASVVIEGTNRGSATTADGTFMIRRAPAGDITLIVTYIGYESRSIDVSLDPGEELEIEIELEWSGLTGDEVVITGQARGQISAINEQLRSRSIRNIVSSERIRELPDDNAATALSRLPGISLQEGDKVVIRGMEAKMNTVMVNGIQLPSTDSGDRSTNLGFISSNMLDGIDVTKAVTPDMDANSIGGAVNLRLRQAPEDFHFDVLTQGAFNTQNRTYGNFDTWASVSNRFLDNRLGVFLQGNMRRFEGGSDFGSAEYERMDIGSDPGYGEAVYGMQSFDFGDNVRITEERGGSLLLDYDLPNGKIIIQNTYAYTENDNTRHIDRLFLNNGNREFRLERDIHNKHLLINALQGEHSFWDDITLDYGLSHAHSQRKTDQMYALEFPGISAFNSRSEETRRQLTPDSVYAISITSDHWQTQQLGNGSTRDEEFYERQLVANANLTIPVDIGQSVNGTFKTGGKITQMSRENDVTRHLARLSEPGNYSAGREYLESIGVDPTTVLKFGDFRNADYSRGEHFLGGNYTMTEVIDTDLMDEFMGLAYQGWGGSHLPDTRRFDYDADERLTAGYAMIDLDIGSRLSFMTGLRYEHFEIDYEGTFVRQGHWMGDNSYELDTLNSANTSVDHWFPNIQLRYEITDWMDVRTAYTKTLTRPNYNMLMPSVFVDNDGNRGEIGNPYLRPTVSQNYDLYVSFHSNRLGLFTVGGFLKDMDDVILPLNIQKRHLAEMAPELVWPEAQEDGTDTESEFHWPSPDAPDLPNVGRDYHRITTYLNNPNPAEVYGIEVDWQTNFWYLPQPFNSMVLNVNYTRITSEMDYRQILNVPGPMDPFTGQRELEMVDTVRTARLLHQGDHIVNVTLGADVRGFSGRVSFRMQGDVITQVGDRPEEDAFTGNIYGWDFTIRQQLPVEGLSVFLNGMNISHSPTKDYQNFRRSADADQQDNLRRTTYNARRFELGARFSF